VIYLIEALGTGFVKIGYSNNPSKRLSGLQTASPHDLTLFRVLPGEVEDEHDLHQRFSSHRVRGEWFESGPVKAWVTNLEDEALVQRVAAKYMACHIKTSLHL
jgi:hypothetical protein